MGVLLEMLQTSPYSGMPLQVHVLDEGLRHTIIPELPAINRLPNHMSLSYGSFDELEHTCAELLMASKTPLMQSSCAACREQFRPPDRIVSCPRCKHPFHVSCAAQALCSNNVQLLPKTGPCSQCGQVIAWPVLLRTARRLGQTLPVLETTDAHPGDCDGDKLSTVRGAAHDKEATLEESYQLLNVEAESEPRCPVTTIVDTDDDEESTGCSCNAEKSDTAVHASKRPKPAVEEEEEEARQQKEASDAAYSLRSRLFKRRCMDGSVFGI